MKVHKYETTSQWVDLGQTPAQTYSPMHDVPVTLAPLHVCESDGIYTLSFPTKYQSYFANIAAIKKLLSAPTNFYTAAITKQF